MPWNAPIATWAAVCPDVVIRERGISRHDVVFVQVEGGVYAFKELPPGLAEREYEFLRQLEDQKMPAVIAVGHARTRTGEDSQSILITAFLEGSLPYRILFTRPGLERYREKLLDAVTSLIVRLHLAGFYWGDCSLSNTLFRRDAGALQAYAVDVETSAVHEQLSDGQRRQDLMLMEENVAGELMDLAAEANAPHDQHVLETGSSITLRYERLWSEVTRETVIAPGERYRIQERIRALNELGFSVGEFELIATGDHQRLRLRTSVTDRNHHRAQLEALTGLRAGERQAVLLLNEIKETRATLASGGAPTELLLAAVEWMRDAYIPTTEQLAPLAGSDEDLPELFCQVLENKWFLSERAKRDVGLPAALTDYLEKFPAARLTML